MRTISTAPHRAGCGAAALNTGGGRSGAPPPRPSAVDLISLAAARRAAAMGSEVHSATPPSLSPSRPPPLARAHHGQGAVWQGQSAFHRRPVDDSRRRQTAARPPCTRRGLPLPLLPIPASRAAATASSGAGFERGSSRVGDADGDARVPIPPRFHCLGPSVLSAVNGGASVRLPRTPARLLPSLCFPTHWSRDGGQLVHLPASHPSTAPEGRSWVLGGGCRVSYLPWYCAVLIRCQLAAGGAKTFGAEEGEEGRW